MTGLLLKYNKVHNDALQKLAPKLQKQFKIVWGDLNDLDGAVDLQSCDSLLGYFKSLPSFDFVVIGDVFWKTGQNICKICNVRNLPVFFLQHGQWVYIKNKKNLLHYPFYTFLFGDNVCDMCSSWEYAQYSKCFVTGTPRYDECSKLNLDQSTYIYVAPPVVEELIHDKPSGIIRKQAIKALELLGGIDKKFSLIIQPHYREARVDYLQKTFPYAQFVDPDLDPLKFIRGSAKVITSRNSTSVLDALACRKSVVLTDINDTESFFSRFYFEDFALESSNIYEFKNHLNSECKINDDNYVQRAKKYIYLGDASSRIVELISNVMYNVL